LHHGLRQTPGAPFEPFRCILSFEAVKAPRLSCALLSCASTRA